MVVHRSQLLQKILEKGTMPKLILGIVLITNMHTYPNMLEQILGNLQKSHHRNMGFVRDLPDSSVLLEELLIHHFH